MSVHETRTLPCGRCGVGRSVRLVDSANPVRHPPFLDEVLERRFQRFPCPTCGHVDVADGPLLWTDVPHGLVALVLPDAQRPGWPRTEVLVEESLRSPLTTEGPSFVRAWGAGAALRLVYGLEELREKVVARRAGLDDRAVEVCKLAHADRAAAVAPMLERADAQGLLLRWPEPAGRADVVVGRAEYEAAYADLATAPGHLRGLVDSTWVHWTRSRFAPLAPVA